MTSTTQTIWRYDFEIEDRVVVTMPQGAQILHATRSDRKEWGVAVWAQVDPEVPATARVIYVRGTGHPLGSAAGARYIGPVFEPPLVFHVFDGGEATQ